MLPLLDENVRLEPVTLDRTRSVLCLPCVDAMDEAIWEWWAFDTQRPHRSSRGTAGSLENATAAAVKALGIPRRARPPKRCAAVRSRSHRPLGQAPDRPLEQQREYAPSLGSGGRERES